jgi:hypothetical protein
LSPTCSEEAGRTRGHGRHHHGGASLPSHWQIHGIAGRIEGRGGLWHIAGMRRKP